MGFSNFTGQRIKPEKKSIEVAITVSDYMAKNLITFNPNQSLAAVMEILARNEITGGPVVDEKGRLIGMISESDCMKQLSDSRYFNMPMGSELVERYMTRVVETIASHVSIFEAATQFNQSRHRRFPVLENGKLVGQISQHDVILAALRLKSSSWK